MLKTTKIIISGLGIATLATAAYFTYTNYNKKKVVVNIPIRTGKSFDTMPGRDSSLEKLNKILSDNQEAKNNVASTIDPSIIETYENIDKNSALYDSLMRAGEVVSINENSEKPVGKSGLYETIRAEKFLEKKNILIKGEKSKVSSTDSLAANLAEVKSSSSSSIMVEFWESPVNYKGYRLAKNKMILFGIIPENIQLIRYNGELYVATINNVYLVKACADFCKLNPIKDKSICAEVMRYAD